MTIAQHPKEREPCPECGGGSFLAERKVKQIGQTYTCDECGVELFVYDNSDHGMGDSLIWSPAEPVVQALGHGRECLDCGYNWHYGGAADRPTCPDCKGKDTEMIENQEQ